MIILGEPDNFEAYYMCDGDESFELQQQGFCPKYMGSDGEMYFKKNSKLIKYLKAHGVEL